jgi:hypothetical protein
MSKPYEDQKNAKYLLEFGFDGFDHCKRGGSMWWLWKEEELNESVASAILFFKILISG